MNLEDLNDKVIGILFKHIGGSLGWQAFAINSATTNLFLGNKASFFPVPLVWQPGAPGLIPPACKHGGF